MDRSWSLVLELVASEKLSGHFGGETRRSEQTSPAALRVSASGITV